MNAIERALKYKGETIAVIPNQPPAADLEILNKV